MRLNWGNKGNYPYTTSRVKAKKSLLITKDVYPKLLNMDLVEISRFMGETQYKVEMAELASRYDGVNLIEMATYRSLARVYTQILDMAKGELRCMIAAYLKQWDVWNVKTILRGKTYGASMDDIQEDLVPAGEMRDEDLIKLASMENVEDIIDAVQRIEGMELPVDIIEEYRETGRLGPIEDYLDRFYYANLLESVKPNNKPKRLFHVFIRKEIDIINLSTLLKLRIEDVSGERICRYFIEGGEELDIKTLTRMANSDEWDQMVQELTRLSFYEVIKEGLEEARSSGTLTGVVSSIHRQLIIEAERFSHLYPLSILPIMDYMIRKKTEVDNIRVIARGKESGMDSETIRNLLVI